MRCIIVVPLWGGDAVPENESVAPETVPDTGIADPDRLTVPDTAPPDWVS